MLARFKAFNVHLLVSFVIALAVVALVFGLWYPTPLHEAVGATQIFLILLGVDVCLGPLLTLIVYKPNKKSIVMDLTIIALLQVSALAYGIYAMAEARPAWLVYNSGRFELIRVNDINNDRINEAAIAYQQPSKFGPQWVAVKQSMNGKRRSLLMEAAVGSLEVPDRPNNYEPLSKQLHSLQNHARKLNSLAKFNNTDTLEDVLGADWESLEYVWLPLIASSKDMVVLLNPVTGEPIKVINLRPW